jgi:HK97 family phage portal protein
VSLFRAERTSWPPEQLVPARGGGNRGGIVPVTTDAAKRHSAVWACLRLRADLVSAMPIRVYRKINQLMVETSTPPVLSLPGGERVDINEWMFSSQWDLDAVGNCFGIITKLDGYGLPAQIELQARETVTVVVRSGKLRGYRIAGKFYEPPEIWHERQFTQSGMVVGLSPIAYAALGISEYLSAQQFALAWFTDGAIPMGKLKNNAKTINEPEAEIVKSRFKNAVANRDVFVHGMDWDYDMLQGDNSTAQLLETKKYSIADMGRFFGVPGDLLDAEALHTSKIVYTNITQRHLQFLVMHLQASITRRQVALTRLTPASRFVVLDPEFLLSMDPMTLATYLQTRIDSRTVTPDEARVRYYNQPALTKAQIEKLATIFPGGPSKAASSGTGQAGEPTDGSAGEVNAA